jgi:hypothetical protein
MDFAHAPTPKHRGFTPYYRAAEAEFMNVQFFFDVSGHSLESSET